MFSLRRKLTTGAAVAALAAGLLTVGAVPAAAATVRVDYQCAVELMVLPKTFDITVTAPATATRGQTATVSATVADTLPAPDSTPAGAWSARLYVNLGGASTGTLQFELTNPAIPAGTPFRMTGSTSITFADRGTVTYQPGSHALRNVYYSCRPADPATVPVAATTRVS